MIDNIVHVKWFVGEQVPYDLEDDDDIEIEQGDVYYDEEMEEDDEITDDEGSEDEGSDYEDSEDQED